LAAARPHRCRGKLIAAEGLDAAARATQLRLLEAWLRRHSAPVSVCRAHPAAMLTPLTASLRRAETLYRCLDREIVPLLRAGRNVCVDGYMAMAAAEDAARGLSRKWIRNLYARTVAPNLWFYFRLPLEAALAQARPPRTAYPQWSGDADESFRLYQGRLLEEMDRLAAELPLHVIDATRTPAEQQREMRDIVRREILAKPDAPAA
jgi:dTMP kinase